MRKLVIAALLTIVTGQLAAQQRAWTPAIGIQGGYTRVEPTGNGGGGADHIDFFDIPGQAYVGGLLTYGGLYVILPVGTKAALEPSMTLSYLTTNGSSALATRLGLRANYAFSDHLYAAAGATLAYVDQNPGLNDNQFGIHVAGGYRFRLNRVFNGRVEFGVTPSAKGENLQPVAAYTLLFGVSSTTAGTAQRTAPGQQRRQARFGFQGGLSSMTQPEGDFQAAFWAVPLIGGSVTSVATAVASPPTLFLVFPIGARTSLDVGFDLHRVQQAGSSSTSASANLAARLLLMVTGNWYAAGGLNIDYLKSTGVDGGVWTGANVGWGYEFPVRGHWRGRAELNFQAMKEEADLGVSAQNVVSLLFALTVPVK